MLSLTTSDNSTTKLQIKIKMPVVHPHLLDRLPSGRRRTVHWKFGTPRCVFIVDPSHDVKMSKKEPAKSSHTIMTSTQIREIPIKSAIFLFRAMGSTVEEVEQLV